MGPTAFRDGIFSSSDPMSKYGMLVTSFSDGTLGDNKLARPVQKTEEQTYEDYVSEYDDKPNYALWGLVTAGVIGVGALGYMVMKK